LYESIGTTKAADPRVYAGSLQVALAAITAAITAQLLHIARALKRKAYIAILVAALGIMWVVATHWERDCCSAD
jgi:hypothetical protein